MHAYKSTFATILDEKLAEITPPLWRNDCQNNSVTIFFGKRLDGKSCKSPANNSTRVYFGKSPFPVGAPLPGEGGGGGACSYQTPKILEFGKNPDPPFCAVFVSCAFWCRFYPCFFRGDKGTWGLKKAQF